MAGAPNPNYGQTFTKGVKYLKINRLDKDGMDFGPKLALADNIRINYPDIGAVQYNILTTQQQGNSYLMGVIPQETTSSLNNIKDYDVSLAKSPISIDFTTVLQTAAWEDSENGGLNVASGNGGGYYNTTSDLYSFNLANPPLSITSSITVTSVVGSPIWISVLIPSSSFSAWNEGLPVNLWDQYGIQNLNIISINSGDGTYTGESNINDIPGGEYYFGGVNFSFLGNTFTLTAINEEINQEIAAYDSPDEGLLNISPETLNFAYSDYNAILGNADTPQFSNKFQDVDYSDNYVTPINFELIISGTAQKAQIQDSNYTQTGWTNGRYNGSRNSSTDFNQ
jgi:hypothetical protein